MAKIKSKYSSATKLVEAWISKDAPHNGYAKDWHFSGDTLYFQNGPFFKKFKGLKKTIVLKLAQLNYRHGGYAKRRIEHNLEKAFPLITLDSEATKSFLYNNSANASVVIFDKLLQKQGETVDLIFDSLDPDASWWGWHSGIRHNWHLVEFNRLAKRSGFNELILTPTDDFERFAVNFCTIRDDAENQKRARNQYDFWNLSGNGRRRRRRR